MEKEPVEKQNRYDYQSLLYGFYIRLKRLKNEGFGSFFLSISLFCLALALLRPYYVDYRILDSAVKNELLDSVATEQEPSDNSVQLGLIATVLARINKDPNVGFDFGQNQRCLETEDLCNAVNSIFDSVKSIESADDPASKVPTNYANRLFENAKKSAPTCASGEADDKTSVLLPTQMHNSTEPPTFSPRINRDLATSEVLDHVIKVTKEKYASKGVLNTLVQVYFISEDSALRIWSSNYLANYSGTDDSVCKNFPYNRLWASKSYFTFFRENQNSGEMRHVTKIYVDYGGNGLVQTHCRPIQRHFKSDYEYGRNLLGILCVDLKLSDEPLIKSLAESLFFQTAIVTFPRKPSTNRAAYHVWLDSKDYFPDAPFQTKAPPPNVGMATAVTNLYASVTARETQPTVASQERTLPSSDVSADLKRAVEIQGQPLMKSDILEAVFSKLSPPQTDINTILRSPTQFEVWENGSSHERLPELAFLLPLGSPLKKRCGEAECIQAMFFYPRSPSLPMSDKWLARVGYFLVGAAVALALSGRFLRNRAEELRNRLTLFRNLQVGVVKVDEQDLILEANDRAEELFQTRLPKYGSSTRRGLFRIIERHLPHPSGARRLLPVDFNTLLDKRLRERAAGEIGDPYRGITLDEISELRKRGQSSWYYARLSKQLTGGNPKWVRVSATPMMLGGPNKKGGGDVRLDNIFATVSEVTPELSALLNQQKG